MMKLKSKQSITKTKNIFAHYIFKIHKFKPKIKLLIDTSKYTIKTAQTSEEFADVLRLRYDVFLKEFKNKKKAEGLDIDKFDLNCDHLLIIDKSQNKCIGTYRLICSTFSTHFYSDTEFKIDNILKMPGIKLELGRACVDKDARRGIIITLLWKGLSEYIRLSGADYLFGCSSIKTTNIAIIGMIYKYLNDHFASSEDRMVYPRFRFNPKNLDFCLKLLQENPSLYNEESAMEKIPSLLRAYLNLGAKICGKPALDKSFKCVDFFTLLDLKKCPPSAKRKFNLCG